MHGKNAGKARLTLSAPTARCSGAVMNHSADTIGRSPHLEPLLPCSSFNSDQSTIARPVQRQCACLVMPLAPLVGAIYGRRDIRTTQSFGCRLSSSGRPIVRTCCPCGARGRQRGRRRCPPAGLPRNRDRVPVELRGVWRVACVTQVSTRHRRVSLERATGRCPPCPRTRAPGRMQSGVCSRRSAAAQDEQDKTRGLTVRLCLLSSGSPRRGRGACLPGGPARPACGLQGVLEERRTDRATASVT